MLFDGGGKTIKTGSWGFHIEANAKLCLYNVNLIAHSAFLVLALIK